MVWTAKITSVNTSETYLDINIGIYKDNVEKSIESFHLEGDSIDLGRVKGEMLKKVNKLKGIDEKKDSVVNLTNAIFTLNNDGTDLIKQ